MSKIGVVKGFKVFNPDWTCNWDTKQFTCPGKFEEDITPICFVSGMLFCRKAADCFSCLDYAYEFNPENKVAEVIAYGDITEEGNMCCTNKLEIIREIPWAELLEIVNTGKGNSGYKNSGNRNSGDWNSGNRNSGDYNRGYGNSGYQNTGDYNSGDFNIGDYNSGYGNNGDYNSGGYNSGNRNSGDWNKCSFSNGCFNTASPKIYLFDKPSEWTYQDWFNSEACVLLNQISGYIPKYIDISNMTDEEKAAYPEAETTGGYLKISNNSECVVNWWRGLSGHEKAVIKAIPNFDKEIFKQIVGIDVDAD